MLKNIPNELKGTIWAAWGNISAMLLNLIFIGIVYLNKHTIPVLNVFCALLSLGVGLYFFNLVGKKSRETVWKILKEDK